MAEVIDLVAGSLAEAAPDAERHGVTICLEAHDAFCRSEEVASVLRQVDSPYVKAVWDVHHPYRMGECEVPCREILDLLAARGYNGFICAEWEKKWHPEIEEPEIALPQHARVLREWMAGGSS
ncbi:MAG: TIM barrel protein [Caldilineaceae bacterium]|nr:TIM barrel protein [Caldilineaceae bacterium]MDE0070545.1 TIM barrel protein [Caldilineaceae bacterium]